MVGQLELTPLTLLTPLTPLTPPCSPALNLGGTRNTQCQQRFGVPKANCLQSQGCRGLPWHLPGVNTFHKRPTPGLELIHLQPQLVDLVGQTSLCGGTDRQGLGLPWGAASSGVTHMAIAIPLTHPHPRFKALKHLGHSSKEGTAHAGTGSGGVGWEGQGRQTDRQTQGLKE